MDGFEIDPMYSITKRLGPYPFAHRQPKHEGHCKLIHGHNWYFEVTLTSHNLDENGFVYDFGKFKPFKAVMENLFDHTLVLCHDDPELDFFRSREDLFDLTIVPSASCEGLAERVWNLLSTYLNDSDLTNEVIFSRVRCFEDEKNTAIYE